MLLLYLGICAVLAFIGAALAAFLAVSPAPSFHMAFAVGAMPLIFGAVVHFVPVLTRSGRPQRVILFLPLLGQVSGVLAVLGLAGVVPYGVLHAAALATCLVALVLISWMVRCQRRALGTPHPGVRWYVAAMLALLVAVGSVPLWLLNPEWRAALRLLHLHLNTLGFIGLAALGTLPVLLPTVLGQPEPTATERLRRDVWIAADGAFLVAAGAAFKVWLALPGALLLGAVALRHLHAWRRTFGWRGLLGHGASASLVAATLGLLWMLLAGVGHALGVMESRAAIAAFVAIFLLPLVTGALTQLLPVWRYPGVDSAMRRTLRDRLAWGGRLRAALFLVAGTLLSLGWGGGAWLALAGLLLFVGTLLRALLDSPLSGEDNFGPN